MDKKFRVKAYFEKTKRNRTIILSADNKDQLIKLLKTSGYSEPFEINEEEPEMPTEAQIEYAKILNIEIPNDATKQEVSALISRKKEGDTEPNSELIEFAKEKQLNFPKYIGKRSLYDLIFFNLTLEDKIAFFLFSVYRWLSEDRQANLNKHKSKETFYEFAKEQITNEKFIKSLNKYQGSDLRFFGTLRFSDGGETYGGSINTFAYKTCSNYLSKKFGIPKTKIHILKSKQGIKLKSKSGCLGIGVLGV